jgi:hypothetical protein
MSRDYRSTNVINKLGKGKAEPDTVVWTSKEGEEVCPDTGNGTGRIWDFLPAFGSAEGW